MKTINTSSAANSLWIYGKHAVFAALSNPKRTKLQIIGSEEMLHSLHNSPGLSEHVKSLPSHIVSSNFIDKTTHAGAVHQNIALEILPLPIIDLKKLLTEIDEETGKRRIIVILDHITDPHNVGAILRSAAAFDALCVITTKNHSPKETGLLAKASSGALERVPLIRTINLVRSMDELKEASYWCVGMDGKAPSLINDAFRFTKIALILGAEHEGLRSLTRKQCDMLVRLPMSSHVESLNVSNAASVGLYALSHTAVS